MWWRTVLAVGIVFLAALPAQSVVIDHTSIDGVAALPQATMDAIGEQRWLFTHASVGGNMIDGMNALHTSDSLRYKLSVDGVSYDSGNLRAAPPGATVPGTIYECGRGNPGWSTKFTIFDNSVRTSGWRFDKVDFAMDKLCYIDQTANAADYANMMSALEAAYPATRFVYTTMPLTTSSDNDNILRNNYNAAVRTYCTANNKLLFDIADMEAYNPSGVAQTFLSGGNTYYKLYSGYSSDGGHLNAAGQQRIALGWYATAAAAAVPEPGSAALLAVGALGAAGLAGRLRRRPSR